MKPALCQMSMSPDPQENFQKSLDAIRTVSHENADLIVFPELQFYLYKWYKVPKGKELTETQIARIAAFLVYWIEKKKQMLK